ncbi:uncharacterized protein LOC129582036 [Paramacrobiotus metropolitanus]|uniref:uncharacterized protein LOC129582036 n=1 Tax=Paramacrobiotus metropolitanus TaxID=2943436 RepID=UPI0024460C0A|nr:uncharacterized protein LOC129582036 [Paramacrobiotus metropolitanus]
MPSPQINVEFAGGVELLFDNAKKLKVSLNSTDNSGNALKTLGDLLQTLKKSYIKQRPELFMQGDSIRPGILVVINDCDWELMGGLNYALEAGDKVVFISTLHGG